jgi:asparagine synthase (glutamine-hydrolysing)
MCAIAGIVRFDQPAETSRAAVKLMLRQMRHRGPDDSGLLINSHAALGNARLSLVDRAGGAQPMTSPNGRWHLTYNGEVYNWRELRHELSTQWTFQTECDTEVVLAALALWGEAALTRFNGMFALFLWDEQRQTGFAARDRLGVKPFVFSHEGGVFAFSSEAKALVANFEAPRANADAVLEYLIAPYFSGVERPMFATLRYLPAGQYMRVSRMGIEMETWWDWRLPNEWESDEAHLAAELTHHLESGVQHAMRTDHKAAAFLSGGLDSTLLSSLAIKQSAGELRTFAIQFQEQAGFDYSHSLIVRSDDTPHAEAAAQALGSRHSIVSVSREHLTEDLRSLVQINDALPAWEQELAQHHLARTVAEDGFRCVLVGDAADETHYGYSFLLDVESARSPGHILRRFGLPPLNPELAATKSYERLSDHYQALAEAAGHRWDDPFACLLATTYLIVKRWLPRLLHNGDIHSMAYSVEARVPFADNKVLELSRRVHPSLALQNGSEKRLLRLAARGLMPEANRTRPKSALPKDQRCAPVYQREAAIALEDSGDFIGAWLDLHAVKALCHPDRQLNESERALLFRVISLHHWRHCYNVRNP